MGTHPWTTLDRFPVTVDQYRSFHADGFLIVRGLVLPEHVAELRQFSEDLMFGRIEVEGVPSPEPGMSNADMEKRLLRIHMLHCQIELCERYLLYPRVLDVVEALKGPDVLALQTMLFIKGPGANGQGFHQDSYYIPTFPDTLLGAWIAIDPANTENGCLWMARESQHGPIYPPKNKRGYGDWLLHEIEEVEHVGGHSNDDDDPSNTLRPLAEAYEQVPCIMEPGDVAFFGGRVMHRSLSNKTSNRTRRSFVNHYCNARSFTPWLDGNAKHILARGNTSLPFALPRFGTPCAALNPQPSVSDSGSVPDMMVGSPEGTMEKLEGN